VLASVTAALAVAATLALTPAAQAGTGITRQVFQDCSGNPLSGACGADRDMVGPFGFGRIHYGIQGDGSMLFKGFLQGAGGPNTEYDVTLWCNPTHATSVVAFGSSGLFPLTTDGSGNGSIVLTVPPAQLQVCGGPGANVHGHADFDDFSTGDDNNFSTYVGPKLNFKAPG
jgi:hypothetical protein